MDTVQWNKQAWTSSQYRILPNLWKKFSEVQLMELIEVVTSSPQYQRSTGTPRSSFWIDHASNIYKHIYLDKRFPFDKVEEREVVGNQTKWGKMSWCSTCRKSVYEDLIRFGEKVKSRNGL